MDHNLPPSRTFHDISKDMNGKKRRNYIWINLLFWCILWLSLIAFVLPLYYDKLISTLFYIEVNKSKQTIKKKCVGSNKCNEKPIGRFFVAEWNALYYKHMHKTYAHVLSASMTLYELLPIPNCHQVKDGQEKRSYSVHLLWWVLAHTWQEISLNFYVNFTSFLPMLISNSTGASIALIIVASKNAACTLYFRRRMYF